MKALTEYWNPNSSVLKEPRIWVPVNLTDQETLSGSFIGRTVTEVLHESEEYYPKVGQFLFGNYIASKEELTRHIENLKVELQSLKDCEEWFE